MILFRDSSIIFFFNVIERKKKSLFLLSAFSILSLILVLLKIPNIDMCFGDNFGVFWV